MPKGTIIKRYVVKVSKNFRLVRNTNIRTGNSVLIREPVTKRAKRSKFRRPKVLKRTFSKGIKR